MYGLQAIKSPISLFGINEQIKAASTNLQHLLLDVKKHQTFYVQLTFLLKHPSKKVDLQSARRRHLVAACRELSRAHTRP
jgi:hypothetical protein